MPVDGCPLRRFVSVQRLFLGLFDWEFWANFSFRIVAFASIHLLSCDTSTILIAQ